MNIIDYSEFYTAKMQFFGSQLRWRDWKIEMVNGFLFLSYLPFLTFRLQLIALVIFSLMLFHLFYQPIHYAYLPSFASLLNLNIWLQTLLNWVAGWSPEERNSSGKEWWANYIPLNNNCKVYLCYKISDLLDHSTWLYLFSCNCWTNGCY